MQPAKPINRTQNWLIALLLTSTLVGVGIIATLLNQKSTVSLNPIVAKTLPIADVTTAQSNPLISNAKAIMPVSQTNTATFTEKMAHQTAQKLLPLHRIVSVKKVNYEGKLAYEILTDQNQLYLNAQTGEVIAITPLIKPAVQTLQVNYQSQDHETYEHEREHEGEEDDDD